MAGLVVIEEVPPVPTDWTYQESVAKVKQVIFKWKNLTLELATELYIAKQALAKEGNPRGRHTWGQYCQDVGSDRRVIDKWLSRLFLTDAKASVSTLSTGVMVPTIAKASYLEWLDRQPPCDLIMTDPPFSTEIPDIDNFAKQWIPRALGKVKPTGRAYIFIGSYPDELRAYLNVEGPELVLADVLVWTYRNTLGPSPTYDYKLNWQAILYYRGPEASPLNCPIMTEQFSVQDINAPDGRHGDRYHTWQKPYELAERFIRHSTQPGDLVLDCFAGTGTFLVAAADLGREARGCDISEDMVQIAIGRGCKFDHFQAGP